MPDDLIITSKRKRGRNPRGTPSRGRQDLKMTEPVGDGTSTWLDVAALPVHLRRVVMIPCWPDVEAQLMAGAPVWDIARHIQVDRGQAGWLPRNTLASYLYDLRARAPVVERLCIMVPSYRERLQKRFGDRLASLDGLCRLVELQEERLMRVVAKENLEGVNRPETKAEIALLASLWRQVQDVKLELGIVGGAEHDAVGIPAEVVNRIRLKYGEETARTLMDPVSQGRMVAAYKAAKAAAGLAGLDERRDYKYAQGGVVNVTAAGTDEKL